jgi:hypothetical protein
MGGLCIGSLALPRIVKGTDTFWRHPFRTYAAIELFIAVLGLIELPLIPLVGQAYLTGPQAGFAGMLLRGLAAAICLLPPTILMGASLPAMARWIEASPRGASWWGLLYGANIFGAVCGCLIAGFYLLRLFDVVEEILAKLCRFCRELARVVCALQRSHVLPQRVHIEVDPNEGKRYLIDVAEPAAGSHHLCELPEH